MNPRVGVIILLSIVFMAFQNCSGVNFEDVKSDLVAANDINVDEEQPREEEQSQPEEPEAPETPETPEIPETPMPPEQLPAPPTPPTGGGEETEGGKKGGECPNRRGRGNRGDDDDDDDGDECDDDDCDDDDREYGKKGRGGDDDGKRGSKRRRNSDDDDDHMHYTCVILGHGHSDSNKLMFRQRSMNNQWHSIKKACMTKSACLEIVGEYMPVKKAIHKHACEVEVGHHEQLTDQEVYDLLKQ